MLRWLRQSPLRFWLPNLVTGANISWGVLSCFFSASGNHVAAAWFIVWATLGDKLDGSVARLVHGSSNFGVQLDSFSDFLTFGVAPATLAFSYLHHNPAYGYSDGWREVALYAVTLFYALAVTFRLARFNITTMPAWSPRIFFGVPTTIVGGTLGALFLSIIKYGAVGPAARGRMDDNYMFGGLHLGPGAMEAFPIYMLIGAILMVSTLRVPKLGRTPWKLANVVILLLTVGGYVFGPLHILPEYCFAYGMTTVFVSLVYHVAAPHARKVAPPPLFAGGEAAERVARRRVRAPRQHGRHRKTTGSHEVPPAPKTGTD